MKRGRAGGPAAAAGDGVGAGARAAATGGDKENHRVQRRGRGDPEGFLVPNGGAHEALTLDGRRKRKAEGSSMKAIEMRRRKDLGDDGMSADVSRTVGRSYV